MTSPTARRINARLPADVARKVELIAKRTNKTTTEVVLASIERYYDALNEVGERASAAEALERAGFIGCARGPADLSTSYKSDLARSLRKKT